MNLIVIFSVMLDESDNDFQCMFCAFHSRDPLSSVCMCTQDVFKRF